MALKRAGNVGLKNHLRIVRKGDDEGSDEQAVSVGQHGRDTCAEKNTYLANAAISVVRDHALFRAIAF